MIKIESLKKENISTFRKLLLKIFDEFFGYYPKNAQRYNKNHWSEKRLEKYLKNENILILAAWQRKELVGYLIGNYHQSHKSSILWLGVLSDYRGRGIGTKLVESWEVWSKAKGAHLLKTSTANFENERFYKSLGFQQRPTTVINDWGMKKLVFFKKLL